MLRFFSSLLGRGRRLREIHAAKEGLEAGVGAERVETEPSLFSGSSVVTAPDLQFRTCTFRASLP